MTGIERLRTLAGAWDAYGLGGTLGDVARQIERERTCDADTIENVRLIVGGVIDDMERHVSGVEGMEDSPVARWARNLREALGCTDEADEDREAAKWVRDHGGIDYAKAEWRSRSNIKRMYEKEKAKVERQQRHIEFVQGKCRERQGHIVDLNKMVEELGNRVNDLTTENAELRKRAMPEGCDEEFIKLHMSNLWGFMFDVMDRLGVDKSDSDAPEIVFDALDRRLMPVGMEWPRYEDGEPVRIGDVVSDVEVRSVVFRDDGILLSDCTSVPGWGTWRSYKEPIKRPAVLAADGEPLEVGQTVWEVDGTGHPFKVVSIRPSTGRAMEPTVVTCDVGDGTSEHILPSQLTHQRPVLDADGVPIKKGDTVWHIKTGREYVVVEPSYGETVVVRLAKYDDAEGEQYAPDQLTHTKPEPPDSAERIADEIDRLREEVALHLGDYLYDEDGNDSIQSSMELVAKRCRALAERGES